MNDITECQAELDRYAAYIGIKEIVGALADGKPGSGKRAEYAAAIPDAEWEEGRQIRRTMTINHLLADLRRRAVSRKTGKDDTKLGYLLREDYRGYHERWPSSGIVRGDGSIDSSQIRMVMANSIKGRGYTRVQFIAIMSFFYGHECYQKWKNKERVQEELATLWFKARGKRADEYKPVEVQPAPRGRAREHSELVEEAYQALVGFKAGTEAILTTQDLADALGIVRRTACTLLYELTKAGRIVYRSARWNSGIIVGFPQEGVIIGENENSDTPQSIAVNGHKPSETITATKSEGVIIEEKSMGVLQHKHAEIQGQQPSDITATSDPHIYIYNTSTNSVSLAQQTCTPRKRVSIEAAVLEAFDNLPRDRRIAGGELKRWPITKTRVREYIEEHYAECGWKYGAVDFWIDKIRARRKAEPFNQARKTKRDVLEKKAAALRRAIERFEHQAASAPMPEMAAHYTTEAAKLQGRLGLIAWELGQRETADQARQAAQGYTEGEQREFLELVERERRDTVGLHVHSDALTLVERLRIAKERRQ